MIPIQRYGHPSQISKSISQNINAIKAWQAEKEHFNNIIHYNVLLSFWW